MPLTATRIVATALATAKCPGYTAQGGEALNSVLADLCMHHNLKKNLVTGSIVVPANSNGPFNLELTYLRTYDLFYVVNGEPYFLDPCSLKEFDNEVQQLGLSNYPYEYATDLSAVTPTVPGIMYVYPQSNTGVTLTHRYYLKQTDIASPESSSVIPWFEDQDYLVQATAMRMMRITDDSRYATWVQDCEQLLRKHLLTEGDEQQVVKEVQLDPRRFRIGGSSRPTKLDPF